MTEKGWIPIDVARNGGVDPSVLSRLLRGSKNIGVDNIFRILDILGLLHEHQEQTMSSSNQVIDYLLRRIKDLEEENKQLKKAARDTTANAVNGMN